MTIRLGLSGIGTIARAQHLPAIAANPAFTLAATASRNASEPGVPAFRDVAIMLKDGPELDAVVLCTPPAVRLRDAMVALQAGKAVFLEKPPGATLAEVAALQAAAAAANVTLFASWHSRHAACVAAAVDWARAHPITRADIRWHEDVRKWHPGQDWVFQPGGFGVFDPGINALSILTAVLPQPLYPTQAEVLVPQGRQQPIAAEIDFTDAAGLTGHVSLDWRHAGEDEWSIDLTAADGSTLALCDGAARIDGQAPPASDGEYPGLYRRFAELVPTRHSDVDLAPLRFVADTWLRATWTFVEPFAWA